MATVNRGARAVLRTHEGAPARRINAEQQLRRSVMACLLWESEFYEDGTSIAQRIAETVKHVAPETVAAIAREARGPMNLRHVPLLLVRELARIGVNVERVLADVIQRADELAEFMAIYWEDGKQPLSASVKRGLARAFGKFDAYQLAKYDRDNPIRLRDVLFLSHPKPRDSEQEMLWKRRVDGTLPTPDTWETELSAGKDKHSTWERLLRERKLGALALLRNLRNMTEAGVDDALVRTALDNARVDRVLPFRFIAAARHAPRYERELERAMMRGFHDSERLGEHVLLLVDRSGSMADKLSTKSDMTRYDAACGLAMVLAELAGRLTVCTFNDHWRAMWDQRVSVNVQEIPPRHGFGLRDAMGNAVGGTPLGAAIDYCQKKYPHSVLIVITDEQASDPVPNPIQRGYMINVASARNGVGYGPWVHIDGFSEAVVRYIVRYEQDQIHYQASR